MTRTQVYLSQNTHASLLHLAQIENVSLSELIRQGAESVLKKNKIKKKSPQREALEFLANFSNKYHIRLSQPADVLVREQRD